MHPHSETRTPPSSTEPRKHRRSAQRTAWVIACIWLGYSASVLGWAALNTPPADVCITR